MKTRDSYSIRLLLVTGMIMTGNLFPIYSQDESAIQLEGRWSAGECYTIAASGHIAFYGNGSTLEIVDFGNAALPARMSSTLLHGFIEGMFYQDQLLYVVGGKGYLNIVDVGDPYHPEILSLLELPKAVDIIVSGQFAYISAENHGLVIVDVSDAYSPVITSSGEIGLFLQSICLQGDTAYAGTINGFASIDVRDKSNPVLITETDLIQAVRGLDCHDGYLYIAGISLGLLIYDVHDPVAPQWLSSYQAGGHAEDVVYRDNYLYVANRYAGVYVLDITNPMSPVKTGEVSTPRAASLVVSDDFAYIADTWSMSVVDITLPDNLSVVAAMDVGDIIRGIAVQDTHLFIANNYDGVNIVNIASVDQPAFQSRAEECRETYDLLIKDTFAFVADGNHGLRVLNVENPDTPYVAGQVTAGEYISKVVMKDHFIFSNSNLGALVFDVADPSSPFVVDTIELPVVPENITVFDQLLFICGREEGMWIYNISDPGSSYEIAKVETTSRINDIATDGVTAFIAEGNDGLGVLDITNPASPVRLASSSLSGYAIALAKHGNYIYLSCLYEALYIMDVSDPESIHNVAFFGSKSEFVDVVVSGAYIFVADDMDGVYILSFDSLAVSAPSSGHDTLNAMRIVSMVKPNPFTEVLSIEYVVNEPAYLRMTIYNATGQLIQTLINSHHQPGLYTIDWGVTESGITPGVYVLHATDEIKKETIKLMYSGQ